MATVFLSSAQSIFARVTNMSISNQRFLCCRNSFAGGSWVARVTVVPGEDCHRLHGGAGRLGSNDGDGTKASNCSGWPTLRRRRGWDWRRQSGVSMLLPLSASRGRGRERRWRSNLNIIIRIRISDQPHEQALAAEIERNVREEVAAGKLLAEQRQVETVNQSW